MPAGVITSLFLAVLVNRSIRGIYFFRAMFYVPVVSSFVSVALIWLWMYEPQFGLANEFFRLVGIEPSKWLRGPETALFAIILMSVWKNMGLNMVIYLAGLQGIPPHLYEAAEIDGAGRIAQMFRITVPLLAPTTFFVVIVYFIGALQMFVQVFIMACEVRPRQLRWTARFDHHDRLADLSGSLREPSNGICGGSLVPPVRGDWHHYDHQCQAAQL